MPVIGEEDENVMAADFSQLLEIPPTFSDTVANALADPIFSDGDDLHNLAGEWNQPVPSAGGDFALEEPDYSRFDHFIPAFFWPDKPCDYCRSRRLNCYFRRGEESCTPCQTLFRECSLNGTGTLEVGNYDDRDPRTFLDTLHIVDEDVAIEHGSLTGIKPLNSKGGHSNWSNTPPVRPDDAPDSNKRNGIRFPRQAVKVLRDWLDAHADHPYPTEDEKAQLEQQTELKPNQIANWLANARRRRKATERARPKLCMSPSLRPSTPAIAIPNTPEKPWDELNPFERWQHSPPEHEPASMTDIANAVASSDLPDEASSPSSSVRQKQRSSNGSGWSNPRAPSITSLDTSAAQSSSLSASSAAFSQGSSSHGSFGSFSSGLAGKRDRKRRRRAALPMANKASDNSKRIFQCTFCTDTFKSKYDWTRHEKSLHLSLEKWICAPLGPVISDPSTGQKRCVYCSAQDPSHDHMENAHNHRQCEEKGRDARTFYRKDHLRQHVRLMHGCEMTSFMDNWKSVEVNVASRCGFCAKRFTIWQERVDHLTAHFKAGAKMSEWKGCRGLDPAVAAQVTNAMPPYLIGIESVSPNPFSATNRATWRHALPSEQGGELTNLVDLSAGDLAGRHAPDVSIGYGSKATCWEILTVRLGRYANEMAKTGVVLTDEMLQAQARRILYDSDDSWNQTAADNPEWLDLFKKAHGLDFIPREVGGQGTLVPEDLEAYGDLGLRIPFAVQLQAYNQNRTDGPVAAACNVPGAYREALDKRHANFRLLCSQLSKEGVMHDEQYRCGHAECANNMIDVSAVDGLASPGPRYKKWCMYTMQNRSASMTEQSLERSMQTLYDLDKELVKVAMAEAHLGGRRQRQAKDGIQALYDVDQRALEAEGCEWEEHNACAVVAKAGAKAPGLATSTQSTEACTSKAFNAEREAGNAGAREAKYEQEAARARARALNALTDMEAVWSQGNGCDCPEHNPAATPDRRIALDVTKKSYLQRHRYVLPRERAALFATTTGAWQDSGRMPELVSSASMPPSRISMPDVEETTYTTTGAMMEFLGPELGQELPFGDDAATSQIPLPAVTQADSDLALLDELIATTAIQNVQPTATASPARMNIVVGGMEDWTGIGMGGDASAMEDVNFDEMNFDSVFDMPMDETFDFRPGKIS